ncbi:MAG: FtsB family cell division protein [Acidimicrobiales bacterium]
MSRTARRVLWPALAVVAVLGALSLSVFPARTWLGQQDTISATRAELAELDAQVEALRARSEALDSPEEIERLAREQYHMVRPGEEAYGVLPAPLPSLDVTPGWPFTSAPPAD